MKKKTPFMFFFFVFLAALIFFRQNLKERRVNSANPNLARKLCSGKRVIIIASARRNEMQKMSVLVFLIVLLSVSCVLLGVFLGWSFPAEKQSFIFLKKNEAKETHCVESVSRNIPGKFSVKFREWPEAVILSEEDFPKVAKLQEGRSYLLRVQRGECVRPLGFAAIK